ncbi:MAG: ATP-binding protein [Pseudomonadota bacterium]
MTPSHPHLRQFARAGSTNQQLPDGVGCAASPCFTYSSRCALAGDFRVAGAPSSAGWDRTRSIRSRIDRDAAEAAVRTGERRQIAQQIHDDLGGILTGLKACISVLMDRAARVDAVPDPLLVDASALAGLAFDTVRNIAVSLRPPMLEKMDIWAALESRVAQLARRTGIHVDCAIDPALTSMNLGEARGIVILRMVCEALTNIEKHSAASRVSVRLFESGGALTVTVKDNGIGLRQCGSANGMTLGISGMMEQAQDVGGVLVLTTDRAVGTMLQLTMPLGPEDAI